MCVNDDLAWFGHDGHPPAPRSLADLAKLAKGTEAKVLVDALAGRDARGDDLDEGVVIELHAAVGSARRTQWACRTMAARASPIRAGVSSSKSRKCRPGS